MNPVASVNILLSTDLDNLERVIESGGNIVQANPGTYLFSSKNTNFVSLNHELKEKGAFSINLSMQDPDNNVLDNILPKNVNEFIEDGGKKTELVFYLMYGVGKNTVRHWGGPFMCQLENFNYYQDTQGTFMVEMTFVPFLPLQAILNLENLTEGSSVLSSGFKKPKGSKKGDKQSSNVMGETGTKVILGQIPFNEMDTGYNPTFLSIGVSPDDFMKKVKLLYQNYAKHWGIDNLLMQFGKEFFNACLHNLYGGTAVCGPPGALEKTLGSYSLKYGTPPTLSSAITWLAQFGIDLKVIREGITPAGEGAFGYGQFDYAPPTAFLTGDAPVNERIIAIDISEKYKQKSSFKEVFNKYYSTLLSIAGEAISPEYLIESNTTIVGYLEKVSGLDKYINDPKKPLVIIGERNYISREIYALGQVEEILVALPNEKSSPAYKTKLRQYYVNKASHFYRSNYFEDVGNTTDDMSYLEAMEFDETSDVLLTFKANTPDANILDYTLNLDLETFGELVKSFSTAPTKEQRDFMIKELKRLTPYSEKYDIEKCVDDVLELNFGSKFKELGQQITMPSKDWKPAYASYVKRLNDQVFQGTYMAGTIRTVPYFQLSDNLMLNFPCRIIINKNPNLDNYPIDPEDTEAFFSGDYIIIGFRHVVSSSEAYSEFDVLRVAYSEKKAKDVLSAYEISN